MFLPNAATLDRLVGPSGPSGGRHAAQEQQPFHVVDEVRYADLRRRSGEPDGSDE